MSIVSANVTTSVSPVYTSTGNTVLTFLSLCNYSVANVTANVYVVPNGGTIDNSTVVLANLVIPSEDTYQFYVGNEKLIFSNGDSIQVNASGNSAITAISSYTSA